MSKLLTWKTPYTRAELLARLHRAGLAVLGTELAAVAKSGSYHDLTDTPATGIGDVPSARTIATTAPLTGGGDLSADRTLGISAATTSAAGSMSAADKSKLDGLNAGGGGLGDAVSIDEPEFGAVGDGEADDTAAILAAVATGKHVFIPPTEAFYLVSAFIGGQSNQTIFGVGDQSKIQSTSLLANVIGAVSKTNFALQDVMIVAAGGIGTLSEGNGIALLSCSRSRVNHCRVDGHRASGVYLQASHGCEISRNWFYNSPVEDGDYNNDSGVDISVVYGSSGNEILFNHCLSGNGIGIGVTSIGEGDYTDNNKIIGNWIDGAKAYGILLYRNAQLIGEIATQSVARNIVAFNIIENISGTILAAVTDEYNFGAGVYLQGAEDSLVVNNTIRNTHSGSVTFIERLAPGAIGATNLSSATIENNTIESPGLWGIYLADPNGFGMAAGSMNVNNNKIRNAANKGGIKTANAARLNLDSNQIYNVNGLGIQIANTATQKSHTKIKGNQIAETTNTAVSAVYCHQLDIANNTIDDSDVSGIEVYTSSTVKVSDNQVSRHAVRGIRIGSDVTDVAVHDNTVTGTGTSTEGIRLEAVTKTNNNKISGCVTPYAGNYAGFNRTLTVDSATPAVTDGSTFSTANTAATTLTNFTGGVDGQDITIVFNDANTTISFSGSTIKGNGGVNRAMVVNDMLRATLRGTVWHCTVSAAA